MGNKISHTDTGRKRRKKHTLMHKASGVLRGSGDCMSTPAVRIAVTERRANTNVINMSALTPGTLRVSVFVVDDLRKLLRASRFCQTDTQAALVPHFTPHKDSNVNVMARGQRRI